MLDAVGLRKSASKGVKGSSGGVWTFVLPRGPGKPTSKVSRRQPSAVHV